MFISRGIVVVLFLTISILSGCGGGGGGSNHDGGTTSFTLSGTAIVGPGVTADSDVNDPEAPFASNDTPDGAQSASNPGTIIGYASSVGAGPAGSRFATTADLFDAYQVALAAGQVVSLEVSEWVDATPGSIDLDLFLYDASLNPIASSEGVGPFESLVVPASGNHFVVVEAFAGASNYRINIGVTSTTAAAESHRLSRLDDFMIGEAIVTMKSSGKGLSALTMARADATVASGDAGRALLVRLDDVKALSAGVAGEQFLDPWSNRPVPPAQAAKAQTVRAVKALRSSPDVASAGLNYILKPMAVPNDPLYHFQWHYPMIKLPEAWNITFGARAGDPVVVAVVDTGVVLAHPDLQNQLVAGYDFIRNPSISRDGDGIDANPDDPGDLSNQNASSWHGTHVAGTIAAGTNNDLGGAGVAGGAKIMPIRVLGKGGGTGYDILQGILFAAGLANDSKTFPLQKADIINLSLGGSNFDQATQDAVTAARAEGVIVIAAAGNANTSAPSYPAAYTGVVSVSAVGITGEKSSFSNYGTTIDIAAPGGDFGSDINQDGYSDEILSTVIDEPGGVKQFSYAFMSGTSMASPHVSGVAALMKAVAPALTPTDFDNLLANGSLTDEIGSVGRDDLYGYGLVNAQKAVSAAQTLAGGSISLPLLSAVPARLDFGVGDAEKTLKIVNVGGGSLTIDSLSEDAPWLSVVPAAVDGSGLGGYLVRVDCSGLAEGVYSASIVVTSSAGNSSIPVTMDVPGAPQVSNAGRIYFLLIDPQLGDATYQTEANPSNGSYPFSFTAVATGDYRLIAGSDMNNDGFICDPGESCGVWPTMGLPQTISVTSSRNDLTLTINQPGSFSANLATTNREWRGYPLRSKTSDKESR
ncbi:MAG: S8 family peptidase [Desulfuromonadales bacterium]